MENFSAPLTTGSIKFIEKTGALTRFFLLSVYWLLRPPFHLRQLIEQFYFIANKSLFIVTITALFSGMVFAIQFYFGFRMLNAEALVGPATILTFTREISPIFTAIVVSGRAGAAMAAELGTMRVTEQIDALDVMAVNSIQYLVIPRIVAGVLALPLLSIVFLFVANVGSYLTSTELLKIDPVLFFSHVTDFVVISDILQGLIKATFFGLLFSTIGTFEGYHSSGGAQGVGRSTNLAVVTAIVLILISDYFLTIIIRRFLYGTT